jgi:hypothetical protein
MLSGKVFSVFMPFEYFFIFHSVSFLFVSPAGVVETPRLEARVVQFVNISGLAADIWVGTFDVQPARFTDNAHPQLGFGY